MQLSNNKLRKRGVTMLVQELHISDSLAAALLQQHKTVKKAIKAYQKE
jgi:N-acetylmuramic acid 6-phosphate etherase